MAVDATDMQTMLTFRPGEVVAVDAGPLGLFQHVGIVTEFGTVISNSKRSGCVAEESLSEFSCGRLVRSLGYPGGLPPYQVVCRARSQIGEPWSLFSSNCEHLVNYAHGLERRSPQLEQATVALLLVTIVGAALARARA